MEGGTSEGGIDAMTGWRRRRKWNPDAAPRSFICAAPLWGAGERKRGEGVGEGDGGHEIRSFCSFGVRCDYTFPRQRQRSRVVLM